MRKEYEYNPDGVLSYKQDLDSSRFDRKYNYDFGKRLIEARSGPEARGETPGIRGQTCGIRGQTCDLAILSRC